MRADNASTSKCSPDSQSTKQASRVSLSTGRGWQAGGHQAATRARRTPVCSPAWMASRTRELAWPLTRPRMDPPGRSAPAAHQRSGAVCEAVEACRHGRTRGQRDPRSPWRRSRSHAVLYKTAGAITVPEHASTQTGPVCGARRTPRRISRGSRGGASGPRDAVGVVPRLRLGHHGVLRPGRSLPQQVTSLRPWRRRSGGHPARRSASQRREAPALRRGEGHRPTVCGHHPDSSLGLR
jgi:hypothetical protein